MHNRTRMPQGWLLTNLEDIVIHPKSDIVDGPFGSNLKASEYQETGVPIIRLQNVKRNQFIWKDIKFISHEKAKQLQRHEFVSGDIVVTKLGDPLGEACIVPKSLDRGVIVADVVRVRIDERFISTPYLTFALNADTAIKQLERETKGTTRPRVNLNHIRQLRLSIAPLSEQYRIVVEIETQFTRLDAVVTAFKRVQANLKRYRASVLQTACAGRLVPTEAELARAEGRSYESADQLLQRILQERRTKWESEQLANMKAEGKIPKDDRWKSKYREPVQPDTSELPELPEGWVWTSVEQLVSLEPRSLQSGPFGSNLLHSEFQDTGVLAIGIDNVLEGCFSMGSQHRISLEKYAQLEKYAARPLDVLVTVMATVGRCCVVPANLEPAIITKHVYRISANKDLVAPPYLMTALWGGTEVRGQIFGKVQGQTRPGINGEILRRIAIPIPPLDEQHRIVAEVERRLSVIDELEAVIVTNLKRTDQLRQAILKRAFEGKLVPQDPTDEPAHVLLERIRTERERAMEKSKATPQQTKAPQPTGQPKVTAPVQGELALGFRT